MVYVHLYRQARLTSAVQHLQVVCFWSKAKHHSCVKHPDQYSAVMPVFHCSWQLQSDESHGVARRQRSDDASELASGVYSPLTSLTSDSGPCELRVREGDNVRTLCAHCARLHLFYLSATHAAGATSSTSDPGCDSEWRARSALQRKDLRAICRRLICRCESATIA